MPTPLRIDVHVHLGGLGTSGSGISVSRPFRRGPVLPFLLRSLGIPRTDLDRADELYVERLAAQVRESTEIDAAVALALDGRYREGELDRAHSALVVPNDWARDAARRHPELLYGASVSPVRADALDELERVAAEGAVLIKWLPNIMGFDPADAAHVPFYRKLVDLRLPLLSHCGMEFTLPGGNARWGDPLRLHRALDEGVTVIAAHCSTLAWRWQSGEGLLSGPEQLARLMERHPTLHADLSALTSLLRGWSLRSVLEDRRLIPRLVDASDFPVPCTPLTQLGRVPLRDILAAHRERNYFDRDRRLKRAAGVTPEMAHRGASLLRRGPAPP